ncbi:hypothetical protein MASR2M39_14560 [Ignavibacteriales bacterium]
MFVKLRLSMIKVSKPFNAETPEYPFFIWACIIIADDPFQDKLSFILSRLVEIYCNFVCLFR